jgi:hypothetical protein
MKKKEKNPQISQIYSERFGVLALRRISILLQPMHLGGDNDYR